jgi:hypothetical protein
MLAGAQFPSLLDNAMRVLRVYGKALVDSALQVYQSVLLTMPRCSLYELEYERVQGLTPHLISGHDSRGDMVIQLSDIDIHSQLEFSPNGDFLAIDGGYVWDLSQDNMFHIDSNSHGEFGCKPCEIIFGNTIWDFHFG